MFETSFIQNIYLLFDKKKKKIFQSTVWRLLKKKNIISTL